MYIQIVRLLRKLKKKINHNIFIEYIIMTGVILFTLNIIYINNVQNLNNDCVLMLLVL